MNPFRILSLSALVVAQVLTAAPGVQAEEIYPLVFPVAGEHHYSDTWGAPRSNGRTHKGTDIMAEKMVPVVAAADGTVGWMHNEQGGRCCAMALRHDDGWESWYIHLNNDTPGTDDGQGWGFAPGIERGVHVDAGQLIGWVGDSGNAEWTAPHVHFELHTPEGVAINPYPHLVAAQQRPPELLPRRAGENRYATAAAVSQALFDPGVDRVFLATGVGYADALAAGAVAGSQGAPILLTGPDRLPAETASELSRLAPAEVVILGGEGAVSAGVEVELEPFAATISRWSGRDRFATAAAITAEAYPEGADVVYIANGFGFADALAGAPAAALSGAPLLLTAPDTLPVSTAAELLRLGPSGVVVLGGDAAVSPQVVTELASLLPEASIDRLTGSNRYATAAAVSEFAHPDGAVKIYVATGTGFADALAGAPAAAMLDAPVLLVNPEWVPGETASEIVRLGATEIVILGGHGAVGADVEQALFDLLTGP